MIYLKPRMQLHNDYRTTKKYKDQYKSENLITNRFLRVANYILI